MPRNRNKTLTHLQLFDQLLQRLEVLLGQILHIREIHRRIPLAPRADVLVDVVGFRLQYPHAPPMEPILTPVTTNIKPKNHPNKYPSRAVLHINKILQPAADKLTYKL